jgi:hypothetical protein
MKPPAPPAPPNHSVPVGHAHTGPKCPECGQPTQLADTISHGGKEVASRYVCFCGGILRHYNFHVGQGGSPA